VRILHGSLFVVVLHNIHIFPSVCNFRVILCLVYNKSGSFSGFLNAIHSFHGFLCQKQRLAVCGGCESLFISAICMHADAMQCCELGQCSARKRANVLP
jgi:hypothetical protein